MIIIVILGILILLCYLIYKYIIYPKYLEFVELHSKVINDIKNLNNRYIFYDINILTLSRDYDNEFNYNNVSCIDYLTYQLQYKKYDILKDIKFTSFNAIHYKLYLEELNKIDKSINYNIDTKGFIKSLLDNITNKLIDELIKEPITEYNINVKLNRVNIQGRYLYGKKETFNEVTINYIIKELDNRNGTFYLNKNIWDSVVRVERGRVSNKLRFKVYERDNYRCRCCGRRGNETDLEIDHIKPVAKGGKSELDNLQTLCTYCNKNKGTRYIKY